MYGPGVGDLFRWVSTSMVFGDGNVGGVPARGEVWRFVVLHVSESMLWLKDCMGCIFETDCF